MKLLIVGCSLLLSANAIASDLSMQRTPSLYCAILGGYAFSINNLRQSGTKKNEIEKIVDYAGPIKQQDIQSVISMAFESKIYKDQDTRHKYLLKTAQTVQATCLLTSLYANTRPN